MVNQCYTKRFFISLLFLTFPIYILLGIIIPLILYLRMKK